MDQGGGLAIHRATGRDAEFVGASVDIFPECKRIFELAVENRQRNGRLDRQKGEPRVVRALGQFAELPPGLLGRRAVAQLQQHVPDAPEAESDIRGRRALSRTLQDLAGQLMKEWPVS